MKRDYDLSFSEIESVKGLRTFELKSFLIGIKNNILIVLFSLFIIFVLIYGLYLRSDIISMSNEVDSIKTSIQRLETLKTKKTLEEASIFNAKVMQSVALKRGMILPSEIEYIQINH
ncbi:hypothetical protein Thena_0658 [Thermodesulfobium narugense DSM 14796]|uniref:Cell division protein FtsL n=1 Tax=Thermodesulfobium narugense DSM 14796 TaxID=747365 RepID=M1E6R8_9BACT|nr:hypothetical protein [Thermodesulfobium narugense]AEE14293.1 hypothetical protein Thena_0658 [Thermodesulfobium narugense DSM 14796]